jgi:trigger factor
MQVTIEDVSPVEKKLEVEIPWEMVQRRLDEAYRDLSRGVQLRGFRRGKVPRSMLEKMFGKTVEQEVMGKLVSDGFVQVAHEQNLRPVAEPVVDDAQMPAKPGEPFRFIARVEVRSEVKPQDYKGLELTRRSVRVTDDDVARALEHKRQELTEYRAIEGRDRTAPTDVLVIGLKGTVGEHKVDREEVRVDLGEPGDAPLPGLAEALRGLPIAAKEEKLSFAIAGDEPRKELAGKTAELVVTIKDAREKVVPALDDDFAKDTGEADTLAELRAKLRKQLEEQDEKEIERELRRSLVRELLRVNEFQVAPALVERQLDVAVERLKLQLALSGVDVRKGGFDADRAREELRDEAKQEVRATLLLDAIAEAEDVKVADADVDKHVAKVAAAREMNAQKLKAEWKKEGRLEAVRRSLREEKTLDLLLGEAKIKLEESGAAESSK